MGHGIEVKCKHCHRTETFQLGVGMMYSSLENVIDRLHYKRRKQVKEILQQHQVNKTNFTHELYHCTLCHSLYGRFHVKIIYDNDQVYMTSYACGQCGNQLELISENDVTQIPCSRCSEKVLQVTQNLLWD